MISVEAVWGSKKRNLYSILHVIVLLCKDVKFGMLEDIPSMGLLIFLKVKGYFHQEKIITENFIIGRVSERMAYLGN